MGVSQKCQYALRSVLELAQRYGSGPTSVSTIAEAQAIPPRFLEAILRQLRNGGFVDSRRGIQGGYTLNASPGSLSVGEIIRFVDGPLDPVSCVGGGRKTNCPLQKNCALMGMWGRARDAVAAVYDQTSIQDLIDEQAALSARYVPEYCI